MFLVFFMTTTCSLNVNIRHQPAIVNWLSFLLPTKHTGLHIITSRLILSEKKNDLSSIINRSWLLYVQIYYVVICITIKKKTPNCIVIENIVTSLSCKLLFPVMLYVNVHTLLRKVIIEINTLLKSIVPYIPSL